MSLNQTRTSHLGRETALVQNPALGALLLWRFTSGYAKGSQIESPTPLPLLFLVLPICLHGDTADLAASTRVSSGIRAFAAKFTDSRNAKGDLLVAINHRASLMRGLTLSSLHLAIASRLVMLVPDYATVLALSGTPPRAGIAQSVREMVKVSERLGTWCAQVSLHEISTILKVRF